MKDEKYKELKLLIRYLENKIADLEETIEHVETKDCICDDVEGEISDIEDRLNDLELKAE